MTHSPAYRVLRALAFTGAAALLGALIAAILLPSPHAGQRVGVTVECGALAAARQSATPGCVVLAPSPLPRTAP